MEVIPNQQRFLNKVFLRSLEVFITIFFFTGGVVSYWRGIWAWQDNFLFAEDYTLSIWASGVIGIFALLISFPMRWVLNKMIKFNEKFDYCPIPRLYNKKKNHMKKSILRDEQQSQQIEMEESVIQSNKFKEELGDNFAIEEETPGNPNSSARIVLVSKKRLPRIKSISAKKFATKTRLANQKAQVKRDTKKTQKQHMDPPKLAVSDSKDSNLSKETSSKKQQSTESEKDEQQTQEGTGDQSSYDNDAADEKTSDSSKTTKIRTPRQRDFSEEMSSDATGPKNNAPEIQKIVEIEEYELEDVDKFKVRVHKGLIDLGFLSLSFVLNLPPLVLILCVNFFVFVNRITLYVSLKVYFMFLGFIAVTVWRYFWGLWDVYTENFYFVEMLYGSMLVGILLLLPFDALNLLASPPCLPRMYETRDSTGKVFSMNWKGFTKGLLPEFQTKDQ